MANTEPLQSPAPFSTWVGVVLLFALFGAIVVAVIGPTPRGDTYEKMRAEARAKKLKDARDEESKALTSYSWIDKNKGTAHIPIDRAMELTVAELAQKKPAPAGPIAAPQAQTAAAPANPAPASPAPGAAPQSSPAQSTTSPSTRAPASPSPRPPQSSSGSPSPVPSKTP